MPLVTDDVTRVRRDCPGLPDALVPGASVLLHLQEASYVPELAPLLRLTRKFGSHDGLQLFTFAVIYLMSGTSMGIRAFIEAFRPWFRRVAALMALRTLPTQASVSRALQAVTEEQAQALADNLLLLVQGLPELIASPSVTVRDAQSEAWHVFDFDPSNVPFRRRDLPEGPDGPPARRRAQAVPGYVGANKRGEDRQRMCALHHAGSGLWFSLRWLADGTTATQALRQVLDAALPHLERFELTSRSIIRMDGEFGSVGAMVACQARSLRFVVRYSRYEILERPEVQAALRAARWFVVSRSPAAKPLWAADLGIVLLQPRPDDPDGTEPIRVRLVVTRRPAGERLDHGVRVADEQLELFATNLTAEACPPAALVALYSGRSTVENRLAQEDREFGLDRTFSHSPPGQMWFATIGLWLWNLLIVQGASKGDLPVPEPVPWSEEPADLPSLFDGRADESQASDLATARGCEPPPVPEADDAEEAPPFALSEIEPCLARIARRHGVTPDPETGTLVCSHGVLFSLRYAEVSGEVGRLVWANPDGTCACFQRRSPHDTEFRLQKRFSHTVDGELARRAAGHLAKTRSGHRPRVRPPPTPRPPGRKPPPTFIDFERPTISNSPAYQLQASVFLPALARASARAAGPVAIRIVLRGPRNRRDRRHPHAPRATWSEREAYWAWEGTAKVTREHLSRGRAGRAV